MAQLRQGGVPGRLIITDTARIADWKRELDEYRIEIVDLIRRLGIESHVEFAATRYAHMPALYRRADVVVYPTVEPEPYGLVPLEAMSTGLPVVASRIGGITETVVDGETGFLVDPGDHGAIADRLALLHGEPQLRRHMGEAGRARVIASFDLHRFGASLLDHYATSVAGQ
jgi:type III pantothenate kinase